MTRPGRSALLIGSAVLIYACTLDFQQYRGDEATGGGTTGPGAGGPGGEAAGPGSGGGGDASGGTSAGGNAAGGNAAGGMAGDCPTAEPGQDEACTTVDLQCFYDANATHCECWQGQFDCDECPATAPTDGGGCGGFSRSRCFYGDIACYCPQSGNSDWNCEVCPATEPNDGDNCPDHAGLHCTWGQTECSCSGGEWNC